MAGFIAMVAGEGHIFKDDRFLAGNCFGQADLDALRDFFTKVPKNARLVIRVRVAFLSSDVEKNLTQATRKLVLSSF